MDESQRITPSLGDKEADKTTRAFIKAARDFESSKIDDIKAGAKRDRLLAIFGLVVGALGILAVIITLPLKETKHWMVRVDNNTGAIDVVQPLDEAVKPGEAVDRSILVDYVRSRESYDWEQIQALYDKTMLLSDSLIQKEFSGFYATENAPHKIYKNQKKILIKNPSVSFVGNLAQVRYEKITVNSGEITGESTKWIATIGFNYANPPMKESDRLINPLGFQVTSYRVDPIYIDDKTPTLNGTSSNTITTIQQPASTTIVEAQQ